MKNRIIHKKPKLVIVAEFHAIVLENLLKPRKVIWTGREMTPEIRSQMLKKRMEELAELAVLKISRRAKINERLNLGKPKIRKSIHKP